MGVSKAKSTHVWPGMFLIAALQYRKKASMSFVAEFEMFFIEFDVPPPYWMSCAAGD